MKIALGLEYKGTNFYGWQYQPELPTVQGFLEEALSKIANAPIKTYCAGRTDTGVHAQGQVVHFETSVERPEQAWVLGTNTFLPDDIRIHWVKQVSELFHARFSAQSRSYCYFIFNNPVHSALYYALTTFEARPLDEIKMNEAATYLLGEHDFSSFRAQECQSLTPMRRVDELIINRRENLIIIQIKANAFLHHMVRNIVGLLIEIGLGCKPSRWAQEVLLAKDRRAAARTAPAKGLHLTKVSYPEEYAIPGFNKDFIVMP